MARLRAARPMPAILRPLFWVPLAAAAAITLAFLVHGTSSQEQGNDSASQMTSEPAKRVPVASRQHLMEVADLGVVQDKEEQPVRLIRTTWLDEIYYVSKPGEMPEKESQIREEVMPVAISTY